MPTVKSFFELRSWQESKSLVLEIYKVTTRFPSQEQFGLTSQTRRAAISIASNIAEGMGRSTTRDLIRFLIQARGSVQEVICQLDLSRELGYLSKNDCDALTARYNGLNAGINAHIDRLSRHLNSS